MTLKASMFEVHCIPDACAQINLVATKEDIDFVSC